MRAVGCLAGLVGAGVAADASVKCSPRTFITRVSGRALKSPAKIVGMESWPKRSLSRRACCQRAVSSRVASRCVPMKRKGGQPGGRTVAEMAIRGSTLAGFGSAWTVNSSSGQRLSNAWP